MGQNASMVTFNPHDVLDFWFGVPGEPEYGAHRRAWFAKEPAFDRAVQERFAPLYQAAAAGELDGWGETPAGALALVVTLDQFPHHLFRDTARAYATDGQALAAAWRALERGFDRQLLPVQRVFLYLPFEHAEDLALQDQAVALFEALAAESPGFGEYLDYARKHREVVARFGRFPHRNEALGRVSSADEEAFLRQPGSRF
jgi:uncharacterized protein (DUF924 family)